MTGHDRRIPTDQREGTLQSHHSMRIRLGGPRDGHDQVHEVRVGNGPLEGLLSSHGVTDDGPQVRDAKLLVYQAVGSLDVVSDRNRREIFLSLRRRGVTGRRGTAAREQLGHDDKVSGGIQGQVRADEEAVPMVIAEVVRGEQDRVGTI